MLHSIFLGIAVGYLLVTVVRCVRDMFFDTDCDGCVCEAECDCECSCDEDVDEVAARPSVVSRLVYRSGPGPVAPPVPAFHELDAPPPAALAADRRLAPEWTKPLAPYAVPVLVALSVIVLFLF